MKTALICSALAFGLALSTAQAAELRPAQRVIERTPAHISQTTTTRDMRGRTATREVATERSGDSRRREITLTGPEGNSKTRSQEANISREDGARSVSLEGTTFRGETYSGDTQVERSDNGYQRQTQLTGPEGKTRSSNAQVSVDREAGSVTKQVNVERANGEQVTRTSVRTYTDKTERSN